VHFAACSITRAAEEGKMGTAAGTGFNREFKLAPDILGPDSSESVSVSVASDADVIEALLRDTPFPSRANGKIDLEHISLEAKAGRSVVFQAGQTPITFKASGGFKSGMGVFDNPADAIASLQLDAPPGLDVAIDAAAGERCLLMLWGYDIAGSFTGSHPIGALGSVTFGVEGKRDARYAVLHRFSAGTAARQAIADTISSWRLPRHVSIAAHLKPETWLIAEADGSVAVNIAAQIGYDFNFVREAKLLGLTHELGVKIDAGVKATFGFEVSGRYIVVLGRESADANATLVRLRLFKQPKKGWNFGLNLTVGVTGQTDLLPEQADDFVKAVFGVHGLQVVKDLQLIEQWTDPTKDISETTARLINKTGLDLLEKTTGINARTEFDKARQQLLGVLTKWNALPDKVAAATWGILGGVDDKAAVALKAFLQGLATANPRDRASQIAGALRDVTFGDTPQGKWLAAIADLGILALSKQLDKVQQAASETLGVLDGDVIRKLQSFINERLNLDTIQNVSTQADFDKVDGWLVKRLSDFLNENLTLANVDKIRKAIGLVLGKRQAVYEAARKALTSRYAADFAANYQKTTTQTALLDIDFDLSQAGARDMLHQVVAESKLDDLLIKPVDGVRLNQAALSHEIRRTGTVQLHMPFFDFQSQHINDSLAKLTVEEDSGRLLAYEVDASDTVTVANRFTSQLSLVGSLRLGADGQPRIDPGSAGVVAYQCRQVKQGMKLADFEHRTTPFIQSYLANLFAVGGPSSLGTFYADLDRAVEDQVHNGTNEFGDVALAMQVALPGSVLASWFRRRTADQVKQDSMEMSRRLQTKLRELIPFYFFQDLARLQPNPSAAALLVWAAIPPSTSVILDEGRLTFNTDGDVFWNFPDEQLRKAMAANALTAARLAPALLTARGRLLEAGDTRTAAFFAADQVPVFQNMTFSGMGETLLNSLLFAEAEIVQGAASALVDMQKMTSAAAATPTKAIQRFADFGADLTSTFHDKVSSVYGGDSLRTLGALVLLEASAALDPAFRNAPPDAMLSIQVLKEGSPFPLSDFLTGQAPSREDVAVAQTLVNAS
jgi:hypothetical protein